MDTNYYLIYHGILTTLFLTLAGLVIGLLLACITTYFAICRSKALRKAITIYIAIIRGTPLLLQIFVVYYGLSQATLVQHSILWLVLKSAILCSLITLSNNSMAYVSNLLIGAIHKIPKSQLQIAQTLGLNPSATFVSIQLPYALKTIMPYYQNEIIMLLKSTSLASTVTVLDLSGSINQIVSLNYQNLKWYSISATIYLIISITFVLLFNQLKLLLQPQLRPELSPQRKD